jgi:uncharacterized damage-inducible protein DinB
MKAFFKEIFDYNHHFNQQLCGVFVATPTLIDDKSYQLFCHNLNAHQIWNNRIWPTQALFSVFGTHLVGDLAKIDLENYQLSLRILEERDLNDPIDYVTSKGEKFSNNIQDVLFHVVNHTTYHRGQIAAAMKTAGIVPLVTDYIFYKR